MAEVVGDCVDTDCGVAVEAGKAGFGGGSEGERGVCYRGGDLEGAADG